MVAAYTHGHVIRTDQPLDNGGSNSAPAPFDLFLASIGTCAGIYVKSFCDNRKIPTDNIKDNTEQLNLTRRQVCLWISLSISSCPPIFLTNTGIQ